MNFTSRENVNFNSITLRKSILGEATNLIADSSNYTFTDIQFYLMVSFVNAIVEENVVIYCLSEKDKFMEKLETVIEPLFNEHIKSNEETYKLYKEMSYELVDYMEREHENNLSVVGILNSIVDALSGIDYQKVLDLVNNTIDKTVGEETPKEEKKIKVMTEEEAIEQSDKMKQLISQFTVDKGIVKE